MGLQNNVEVLDGHLQEMSIKFKSDDLINTEVAPIIDMMNPKMKITKYKRGEQYQSGAEARQPGSKIKSTQPERDSVQAQTQQYAASGLITKEDLRDAGIKGNQSPPIDLQADVIEKNAKDLDLGREIRVAESIFAETGWTGDVDVAGSWAPAATSTFLADIDTAITALKKEGVPPRQLRLMLDFGTLQTLKRIDDLRDQVKYTTADSITADIIARILQIDKVVIGGSIKNTDQAKAGEDAFTGAYIWEKNAGKGSAFLYNFERPTKKSLNAVVQPRSSLDNSQFRITESYYQPEEKTWKYDSMEETDVLVTAAPAGYLFTDTLVT